MNFELKVNPRSKRINLKVSKKGIIIITVPNKRLEAQAIEFANKNINWIHKKIGQNQNKQMLPEISKYQKDRIKRQLKKVLSPMIDEACEFYKVKYSKLTFRLTETRWGSCSGKNTLSFSLKLYYIPASLQKYVVVHEVCHILEHNHSSNFWNLVEKMLPDYKQRRNELKSYV